MRLALETREVGRVTIVRCKGRIVAGGETEALRAHVAHLLRDRRSIVLHLGEVAFSRFLDYVPPSAMRMTELRSE